MTVHGIGREEREREGKKEVTFVFFPWENAHLRSHNNTLHTHTHTHTHTHVTLQRLRIMKVRYVSSRDNISVCVYKMVGLFEVVTLHQNE